MRKNSFSLLATALMMLTGSLLVADTTVTIGTGTSALRQPFSPVKGFEYNLAQSFNSMTEF